MMSVNDQIGNINKDATDFLSISLSYQCVEENNNGRIFSCILCRYT